jgi:hypothetical protein
MLRLQGRRTTYRYNWRAASFSTIGVKWKAVIERAKIERHWPNIGGLNETRRCA